MPQCAVTRLYSPIPVQSEAVRIVLIPVDEVDEVLADIVGKLYRASAMLVRKGPSERERLCSLSNTAFVSSSVRGLMLLCCRW
jgi:hypothetical protein